MGLTQILVVGHNNRALLAEDDLLRAVGQHVLQTLAPQRLVAAQRHLQQVLVLRRHQRSHEVERALHGLEGLG